MMLPLFLVLASIGIVSALIPSSLHMIRARDDTAYNTSALPDAPDESADPNDLEATTNFTLQVPPDLSSTNFSGSGELLTSHGLIDVALPEGIAYDGWPPGIDPDADVADFFLNTPQAPASISSLDKRQRRLPRNPADLVSLTFESHDTTFNVSISQCVLYMGQPSGYWTYLNGTFGTAASLASIYNDVWRARHHYDSLDTAWDAAISQNLDAGIDDLQQTWEETSCSYDNQLLQNTGRALLYSSREFRFLIYKTGVGAAIGSIGYTINYPNVTLAGYAAAAFTGAMTVLFVSLVDAHNRREFQAAIESSRQQTRQFARAMTAFTTSRARELVTESGRSLRRTLSTGNVPAGAVDNGAGGACYPSNFLSQATQRIAGASDSGISLQTFDQATRDIQNDVDNNSC